MENMPIKRSRIREILAENGIKPTSQRVDVAAVLWSKQQHITAESLLKQVWKRDRMVSRATLYNTLKLLIEKGLIKRLTIASSMVFYDTNNKPHHHFYNEDTGELWDIEDQAVEVGCMAGLPAATVRSGVEVMVRVKNTPQAA